MYINQIIKEAQYGPSVTSSTRSVSLSASSLYSRLKDYPHQIKFIEKQDIPGTSQLYCQQMQLLDNSTMVTYLLTTIPISELQPILTTTVLGNLSKTFTVEA